MKLPSIHPAGHPFIIGAAGACFVAWLIGWGNLSFILLIVTLWIIWFFRDPERVTPIAPNLVIAPADGAVCQIADVIPPAELDMGSKALTRVSIFMTILDVHVNRAPISGTIKSITYIPGDFFNASLDKSSDQNERQLFAIENPEGIRVGFVQIAGLIARRIVRFCSEGEELEAGERFGLIRFGSRLDVYLPKGFSPQVLEGQRCVAGETVIARKGNNSVTGVRR